MTLGLWYADNLCMGTRALCDQCGKHILLQVHGDSHRLAKWGTPGSTWVVPMFHVEVSAMHSELSRTLGGM